MAACKNLLCVNSFTEANQKTCLSGLKTNWNGKWRSSRLWRRSWLLFFIFVFEQEGDAQRPTHRKHSRSQESLWNIKDKPSQSSNAHTHEREDVVTLYRTLPSTAPYANSYSFTWESVDRLAHFHFSHNSSIRWRSGSNWARVKRLDSSSEKFSLFAFPLQQLHHEDRTSC